METVKNLVRAGVVDIPAFVNEATEFFVNINDFKALKNRLGDNEAISVFVEDIKKKYPSLFSLIKKEE